MSVQHHNDRGFSLLEILIVAFVTPVLIIAIYSTIDNVNTVQGTAGSAVNVTAKLRNSLRRIGDELRASSKVGEDRNGDKILDAGEDGNGNGRLDADWTITEGSITFNRFKSDGTFSMPIRYVLDNGNLWREVMVDPSGAIKRAIIARQVLDFSITDAAPRLTVRMSVWVQRQNRKDTQSSSVTVVQRN